MSMDNHQPRIRRSMRVSSNGVLSYGACGEYAARLLITAKSPYGHQPRIQTFKLNGLILFKTAFFGTASFFTVTADVKEKAKVHNGCLLMHFKSVSSLRFTS